MISWGVNLSFYSKNQNNNGVSGNRKMKKKKCYFAIKNVSENQISNIRLGWVLCLEKQDHETDSRSF